MTAPLSGYRVLDLTNVLAGPFCCHQLAHLGAEVIKIEVPGSGDLARQLGADPDLNARFMGVSFLAQNSGKRSITVNLKSDQGKAIFRRLAGTADVLVENFRPGVMNRLGLGYADLRDDFPELIYCAISGFGQEGPLAKSPAYDQIVQGMSGVMSVTGSADTAPMRVGYPVADTIGGMTAAFAVAAALAKPGPGRGSFIDVSMLDSVLSTMGWVVSNYLIAGKTPVPNGQRTTSPPAPSGSFSTARRADQHRGEQAGTIRGVVPGRWSTRVDRGSALRRPSGKAGQSCGSDRGAGAGAVRASGCALAVNALNAQGVPAGPVLSVPDVLAHPQIAGREMIGTFDDVPGVDRPVRLARTGMRLDGASPATTTPPPELGADTDIILDELGFGADDIHAFRQAGAI